LKRGAVGEGEDLSLVEKIVDGIVDALKSYQCECHEGVYRSRNEILTRVFDVPPDASARLLVSRTHNT